MIPPNLLGIFYNYNKERIMAETLANVIVPSDDWADINTLSGISVGTSFDIINTGFSQVKIIEAASKPSIDDKRGVPLTTRKEPYCSLNVAAGSLRIWGRSLSPIEGTLNVQEA